MNDETEPRKTGRPRGRLFTRKVITYLCDDRYRLAKLLALRRGVLMTQLMRDLIDEAAKKDGLPPPPMGRPRNPKGKKA